MIRKLSITLMCSLWLANAFVSVDAVESVPVSGQNPGQVFNIDTLAIKAKQLADKPYRAPDKNVPDFLLQKPGSNVNFYDNYRDIRFRPEKALWRDQKLPFQAQMFHLGLFYDTAIPINVIKNNKIEKLSYSADLFDYGKNDFVNKIPADLGFAGFRIHAPIKNKKYYDEVAVFLGASYFRAIGKEQQYGLSARGLAIDTALPSGEEFPFFKEFWLVEPKSDADDITIYALLDSESISGAYRFIIRPGEVTAMDVEARLYPRKDIKKLGIAPLTSMFFYGENSFKQYADFRPEVHDSDGLLINSSNGEWIWRPLQNPRQLQVNSFALNNPRGFGLIQRDQNFDHYQDLEARYDIRPSLWVAPQGDWGEGQVELIQIPTKEEIHDNIAAFWVPKNRLKPGDEYVFKYKLDWHLQLPNLPPAGYVSASRATGTKNKNHKKFILDFQGEYLESLAADSKVDAIISVSENGKVVSKQVYKNKVSSGWRTVFEVSTQNEKPVEMRIFLKEGGHVLSETWSYVVLP